MLGQRIDQGALAAEDEPQSGPQQSGDAQRAERPVPGIIDDDPVERRHGDDDAQRRSLGDDGGRHAAMRIGEPLVDGVGGDRRGRAFARAQDDAAGDQHFQADRAQHGKLHQRPHDRHHQQRVARLHAVGDEAHDHRREGEQEEERRADQTELLGLQVQVGHDRLRGQPDHDLVGEVYEHEQEDQRGHAPRALQRTSLPCHLAVTPYARWIGLGAMRQEPWPGRKAAPSHFAVSRRPVAGTLREGRGAPTPDGLVQAG